LKTQEDIESRLIKLSTRHKRLYIQSHTDKRPENCHYNLECTPKPLPYVRETDTNISPRKSNSIVIIQEDAPVRVCTYGIEHPDKWNGNICDDESQSRKCPMFKPRQSVEILEEEFQDIIKDDEKTLVRYPDIAALQWVLSNRTHKLDLSFRHLFSLLIHIVKRLFKSK
jgi:hypothetical protein